MPLACSGRHMTTVCIERLSPLVRYVWPRCGRRAHGASRRMYDSTSSNAVGDCDAAAGDKESRHCSKCSTEATRDDRDYSTEPLSQPHRLLCAARVCHHLDAD